MSRACDVLVIGSGAAGLSAAVTAAHFGLKVILVEKHTHLGGTSAWSGGWLWIPRNPLAVEAGIVEDIHAPLTYLRSEIGNRVNDPRIPAFLQNGPEMVRFFRENTAMEWVAGNVIPDFHDTQGAAKGGRSVCAAPYDGRQLGSWAAKLRPPLDVASVWGMGIASGQDMVQFFNARRKPRAALHVARRLGRHMIDLCRHRRGTQLVNGNALIARLLRSALDLGVELRTEAPAQKLVRDGTRVTGAVIAGEEIRAAHGTILAAGGFPHDQDRIAAMFDHARNGALHHSAAPPENTGDGLRLGERVGATVADDLIEPGAWAPVSLVPAKTGIARFPHLIERAKPGFIAVGPDGMRFVNEANSYHDFMQALFRNYPGTPHAWIIGDARAVNRFGIGAVKPPPFPKGSHLRSGYLRRGRTLGELARETGLPETTLCETIDRFNANAAQGIDPDFARGTSAYNRIQGDAGQTLRPLSIGPYYAVQVHPGSLGTFAGLRTDACARVLDGSDKPIPGLFAVGNDAASIMGGNYPSGGITLGPGMTFGYIAGRTLAGLPITGLNEEAT